MISHVHIGIGDYPRALGFYSKVMPTLGWELRFDSPEEGWAGWQPNGLERPLFLVGLPFDRLPAAPGNGPMVALLAKDRATVRSTYQVALAAGATEEGPPGLRSQYHPNFYGAYFRDPDGNKICVCCHDPEPVASE